MSNSTSQYLYSVFRQVSKEFKQVGQQFFAYLKKTPIPKILVFCILLAIFITLIPLIIFLFIALVLIKFLIQLTATSNQTSNQTNNRNEQDIIYPRKQIDD